MIRTTLNWTVKNLKAMYDEKETLSFNHPIQRQSAQWNNEQQSLLIHSLLANFPVPSVYVHKMESVEADAKGRHSYSYSVLDGKQRMTTVFSFINGEFSLAEDTPDVEIEDESYEIAGKYFGDLDEDVQQEILRFKFNIQSFEDVTDEVIEDIFFRLNNSTPLTKPQKSRPLMGVGNSIFVNDLLARRFFTDKCCFTNAQLKNSDDMCTLLQGMMLLDSKYRGYEFNSISADEVMRYSQHIKGNYPDECRDRLRKIIGFLDNVFYMKDRNLKKINIPIIFWVADEALGQSVTVTNFRRWFNTFFDRHKEEYSQYCSSGSIKKEKTFGRLNVMLASFQEYFSPQEPAAPSGTETAETAELEAAEKPAGQESDADAGDPAEAADDAETATRQGATADAGDSAEAAGNAETATEQETTADAGDSTGEQNAGGTENPADQETADNVEKPAGQETETSFPDGSQKGADEGNDTSVEDTPDAENADGKVSGSRRETFTGNGFFNSMAAVLRGMSVI